MGLMDYFAKGQMDITLKPGMGWAIYSDRGPSGVCGQACSITMPWCSIMFFSDEDTMHEYLKTKPHRNGVKQVLLYGVIGEYGIGNCTVVKVEPKE